MTDNEIVKALECCSVGTFACDEQCPCFHSKSKLKVTSCRFELIGDALDLINRQKAEIERLKTDSKRLKKVQMQLDDLCKMHRVIKAEAYKEFAEKLKELLGVTKFSLIDNLVKELKG